LVAFLALALYVVAMALRSDGPMQWPMAELVAHDALSFRIGAVFWVWSICCTTGAAGPATDGDSD
jgi:hypothetical protein